MKKGTWFVCIAVAALFAGTASGATMPFGTATGGLGVYYNLGTPEAPANQAYLRSQFSQTNLGGATYNFPNTAPWPPYSAAHPFQVHQDQFGFDMTVPAPTWDGVTPIVPFVAVDWNGIAPVPAGPVAWAISGYSGTNPGNGVPVNSVIRGNGINITSFVLANPGTGVWTVDFSAELISDGLFHWYTPAFGSTPMSGWGLTGKFLVSGKLTYLQSNDVSSGMDFYETTLTDGPILFEAELIPEPLTMLGMFLGLGSVGAYIRKRRMS